MKKNNLKISILGAGSWGTAVANVISQNGFDTTVWTRNEDQAIEINKNKTNYKYTGDNKLDINLKASSNLSESLEYADIVIFIVPSKAVREVAKKVNLELKNISNKPIIGHAIKGIEANTNNRVSEMLSDEIESLKIDDIFFISGPSHAESVIKKDLTAVSIAGNNLSIIKKVAKILSNKDFFIASTISDLEGAEILSALKNIYAIGGGILNGLGFKDNSIAAFLTYSLAEMKVIIDSFGNQTKTADSLAGLGDLIVTSTSSNSRNYKVGLEIAKGYKMDQIIEKLDMVAEGVSTTKVINDYSIQNNLNLPIAQEIYKIIYDNKKPEDSIKELISKSYVHGEENV